METAYDTNLDTPRNKRGKQESATSVEFKNFVSDVEDVVKRVADVGDADVARVRTKIQSALTSARSGLNDTVDNLRQQAKQTDDYVRESPWQAMGIGTALGALIGISIGYLVGRR